MNRLEQLRKQQGLSQASVADFLKITQQAYSNYEKGKREPDYDMLVKISDFYGVSTDWLLNKTDDPRPPDKKNDIPKEKLDMLKNVSYAYHGGEDKELTEKDVDDIINILEITRNLRKGRNGDNKK